MEYVKRKEVLKTFGISYPTLYKMADNNEIETIKVGSHMMYNLTKYLREKEIGKKKKELICYCRVSSAKQKADLERQIAYMKEKYPEHRIISDIGSGLNYNRSGLKEIIDLSINGEIEEIVIAYKDRLTRFGYEMIEYMVEKYSGGKIRIINKEEEQTPTEEITKDIVEIMNVYVAKMNGLRKYKKQICEDVKGCKK
jgi:predicted site-specific integrase-resolvase